MKSDGWRWEQRDDVTLFELLNVLWGRRLLVGAVALTLMLLSTLFSLLQSPTYVAEAALIVRPEEDLGPDEDSVALTQRVMGAVATPDLSREAMRRAGWTAGAGEFNERLGVVTDGNTGEIRVTFSAPTAEEASRAANAYAESFVQRAEELNQQRLAGGTLAAEAEVTRSATLPEGRTAGPLVYAAVAGTVGLLLGGAAALILESRTRRWRGAKDAELTLRAPVLGVIPDSRSEESGG